MDKKKQNHKMTNESEFIFDEVLTSGFTVIPNGLLLDSRLSDSAIGLYCRIIRCASIPDWKIYQSALINDSNGKSKIASAIKKLIETGYIQKIQLRDEKGRMCGVKYKVFSKAQPVEITIVTPKPENPTSGKPTSENQPLINKEPIKERSISKKDSSSKEESEEEMCSGASLILKESSKVDLKLSRKVVEQLLTGYNLKEILRVIAAINNPSEIKNVKAYIQKALVENSKDVQVTKNVTKNVTNNIKSDGAIAINNIKSNGKKETRFNNYEQREYDYDELGSSVLGW